MKDQYQTFYIDEKMVSMRRKVEDELIVDKSTGEEVEVTKITKVYDKDVYRDSGWMQFFVKDLLSILGLSGDVLIKVFIFLLENMDYENKVVATRAMIARDIGVTRQSVGNAISSFIKQGFVKQLNKYQFQLSPSVAWNPMKSKGKANRLDIWLSYNEIPFSKKTKTFYKDK